ncbi:MAG: hydrogenase nickel incorporation protein HypB [Acidimicrobiales bacterium]
MCVTCGCSADAVVVTDPASHDRSHHVEDHDGGHDRAHRSSGDRSDQASTRTVVLEQDILAKNALLAAANRQWFTTHAILAMNLMSSPGSGKTTLLERTIAGMGDELVLSVVEGDQETLLDADRIHAAGCRVVQINTGSGCHLDAKMLTRGLEQLAPPDGSVVLIENVGNLVCPALFDLGEAARVVIMSVTEGADKPRKYPHMFRSADLVLLNKVDLLPYVDFDVDRFIAEARSLRPAIEILTVSATTGEGLSTWFEWLRHRLPTIPGT